MKFYRSFASLLLLSIFVSTSCSKEAVKPSSSTGALTANSAIDNLAPRPFDKQMLTGTAQHTLNEFIRADVRSRLDDEPVGDTYGGEDPTGTETSSVPSEQPQGESSDAVVTEPEQQSVPEEVAPAAGGEAKFHWAKRSFGEAIKAKPTNAGVIVLYADENYYDINSVMRFIEEGRSRIVTKSGVPADKIQVVFGGYRSVPQVELWIIPEGGPMPQFKTDDRPKSVEPED